MNTIDLEVEGMSCGSCVNHVTQALKPVPGVAHVAVDLASGHVRVSGAIGAGAESLVAALADAGYPARLATGGAPVGPIPTPVAHPKAGRGGCCCR